MIGDATKLKPTRLSHYYCHACDVFYRSDNPACARCRSQLDQVLPAALGTVMLNAPDKPRWISQDDDKHGDSR